MNAHPDPRQRLRAELRARRDSLGAAERIAAAMGLAAQLEHIPEYLTDRDIAGYWAVAGELPLIGLIAGLRARGQRYLLPIVGRARELTFGEWTPGIEIVANRFGIPEPIVAADARVAPAALDVVLVPLLGFDRRGNRLGFGGGYYDSSFAFLREREGPDKPLLVGVGYALQETDAIEPMPWDVRLDYIATERELIDLTPPA